MTATYYPRGDIRTFSERPTGALRWAVSSVAALAIQPSAKRLEQEWAITEFDAKALPKEMRFEWRAVPIVEVQGGG